MWTAQQLHAYALAQSNMTFQNSAIWSADFRFKWSWNIYMMANRSVLPAGANVIPAGLMPTSGNLISHPSLSLPTSTITADGFLLGDWEGLAFRHTTGTTTGVFYKVIMGSGMGDTDLQTNDIVIAYRGYDNVLWLPGTGIHLPPGTTRNFYAF
jgi:hypothetical protein